MPGKGGLVRRSQLFKRENCTEIRYQSPCSFLIVIENPWTLVIRLCDSLFTILIACLDSCHINNNWAIKVHLVVHDKYI
jgi:hypothetical protein